MNLKYARTFVTVAELGPYWEQERASGSPSPPCPGRSARCAQELGLKLFDRVGSRLVSPARASSCWATAASLELRECGGRARAPAPGWGHRRTEGRGVAATDRKRVCLISCTHTRASIPMCR